MFPGSAAWREDTVTAPLTRLPVVIRSYAPGGDGGNLPLMMMVKKEKVADDGMKENEAADGTKKKVADDGMKEKKADDGTKKRQKMVRWFQTQKKVRCDERGRCEKKVPDSQLLARLSNSDRRQQMKLQITFLEVLVNED